MGSEAKPLNQREHDLVRYMRAELFHENLLTEDEYAALASERGSVRRLEDYDALRARLAEAERLLLDGLPKLQLFTGDDEKHFAAVRAFLKEKPHG